ncbi:MAG: FAD-dependent oxidoreductase [Anaerolineales bacterium]|nr:FAD-dependent oxidoreductase [Anaerolineales bacterium]
MRVAIVGAGIGGLAAAYDLNNAGHEVVIYEGASQVGGLSSGFRDPAWDWSVERYYHHWFASDKYVLGFMEEVGLREKVFFPRPLTSVYFDGDFYPLDSALAVLRFPGLPFLDRIRLGAVVAYLKVTPTWKHLESVTAHEWMQKWVGQRGYDRLWKPLLIGKFGPHYREVNMAWMWARFKARTPRLGTYEGGFQAFMDELAEKLQSQGVSIHLTTLVRKVDPADGGGLNLSLSDEQVHYDQCLITTSPQLLTELVAALPETYVHQLLGLKSMGAVVLILALKHQLSTSGIYWHSLPKEAGFPFLSMVEHTNYVSSEHFAGEHIVYCGDYLDPDHEYFSLTKEQLLERFLPSLSRFNPEFKPEWVRKTWLFSTLYAQPVPPVNHSESIPDLRTPVDGVWFASMSQVYPWDRGTNFAVKIAREAAMRMMGES